MALIPIAPPDQPVYLVDFKPILRAGASGVLISTLIFGILLHQAIAYFLAPREGKRPHFELVIVTSVVVLSCALFGAQTTFFFQLLIDSYGSSVPLPHYFSPPFITTIAVNPVINGLCQVFFAQRAFKLWGSKIWLAVILGVCILVSLSAGLGQAAQLATHGFNEETTFPELSSTMRQPTSAHLLSAAGTDIVISSLIAIKLSQSKHGFNSTTDHLITRLLALSITTAALTSVVAVICAVFAVLKSSAGAGYVALSMILPRCYAASVLFSLNVRETLTGSSGNLSSTAPRSAAAVSPRSPRFVSASYPSLPDERYAYTTDQGVHVVQLQTVHHEEGDAASQDNKTRFDVA